jgi:ABC-2 type transport system permease protein
VRWGERLRFLCGLFFPVESLPVFLPPVSYLLPLTYGVDILHGAINGQNTMPLGLDFPVICLYCVVLFTVRLKGINRKWIT